MKHRSAPRLLVSRVAAPAALVAAATFGFAAATASPILAQETGQEAKKEAQDQKSKDAQKSKEAQKAEDAKKAQTGKRSVGRGRLSGRQAPPQPASVPKGGARRNDQRPKPATGVAGANAAKPKADSPKPVPVPVQGERQLTPEQQKARAEYEAKLKNQGKQAPNQRYGAAPRPPRNPNAKLEIEFGADKHDFGRARQGDLLSHTFEMKSAGTEPVIISQASPTCGCTLGEIKVKGPGAETAELYTFGDPIEPGSVVELAATLDTKSKRNKTNVRINVYSNDGKTGVTLLALSANVEPFLVATPQFLQLQDIREGTEKVGTIDFRTSSGERVMLSQDETRPIPVPEGLTYKLEAINPDENGRSNVWRATFTVGADSPEGGKSYAMRLNSDVELPKSTIVDKAAAAKAAKGAVLPTVYQVTANVNYRILGALSLQPQYVSLGLVRPGQPVVRNVRLTCHEEDFDLSGVTAEVIGEGNQPLAWADRFKASVKPVSGSNAVDVELRLSGLPEEADGSFRGRVLIKTGHPAKPEEFFRFSGVCRKLAGNVGRPAPANKTGGK